MKVDEYFNPKPKRTTDALVKKLFVDSYKRRRSTRRKSTLKRNLPI